MDHDGPCLDEERRLDVALHQGVAQGRACPRCGGSGTVLGTTLGDAARCAVCMGTGLIGW